MSKPIVSVVLGSYNRYQFLLLTIAMIRQELQHVAHEILVVDGGSDDGSLQWLVRQKDIITMVQHNRGEWLGKQIKRRSWGYFMNLAFKAAQGTYVCMLSDDCLVVPGAIKNGITYFDQQRSAGRQVGALAFYWRDWSTSIPYHVGCTLGNKLYVNHGMYLNDALRDVGYIDEENFFFYNGDGDLCLKLWHKGYEVLESPNSYIEHYPHANVGVRKTNYDRFKNDLKNYLAKWEGIFYDSTKNNVGSIIDKYFDDETKTGEMFNLLHHEIITSNPQLLKGKSWYVRGAEQVSWKVKAGVRKTKSALISMFGHFVK